MVCFDSCDREFHPRAPSKHSLHLIKKLYTIHRAQQLRVTATIAVVVVADVHGACFVRSVRPLGLRLGKLCLQVPQLLLRRNGAHRTERYKRAAGVTSRRTVWLPVLAMLMLMDGRSGV